MMMQGPSISTIPELEQRDFERLSRLIYQRSGINLGDAKQALMRARLGKRLRTLGLSSFSEYYEYLTHLDDNAAELTCMLDAISTNLTGFFREPAHFEYLQNTFFKRWSSEPQIRILSAGCSSGEEPYSIAIAAHKTLGEAARDRVRIIAGDISTRMLARARSGIYTLENVQRLPATDLRSFFLRGTGSSEGLVAIAPEVQKLVEFQHLNLTEPLSFDRPFHAIFCRNVTIYFDRAMQHGLVERFHTALGSRGTLFLGHSESMLCGTRLYTFMQPSVYERRG